MDIKVQLISIIFSFVYGIIFSALTAINYRFLFSKKLIFKTVFTIIYVLDMAILYFLIIKKINYGIVHTYFLLFIGIGFLFGFIKLSKYINNIKLKIKKCLKSVKKAKK